MRLEHNSLVVNVKKAFHILSYFYWSVFFNWLLDWQYFHVYLNFVFWDHKVSYNLTCSVFFGCVTRSKYRISIKIIHPFDCMFVNNLLARGSITPPTLCLWFLFSRFYLSLSKIVMSLNCNKFRIIKFKIFFANLTWLLLILFFKSHFFIEVYHTTSFNNT